MIYEIDKYTEFLCNAKITPTQFYFCWMLHTKDYDNLRHYIADVGPFTKEEIKDLIDRGYVLDSNPKASSYDVINLFVTPSFAEHIIVEDEEAFEQLLDVYPSFVLVNGIKYPSKGLKFEEVKGIRDIYGKAIKKNKFLHLDILSLVRDWKKSNNDEAPMKIDKFVTSKYWEILKQEGGRGNGDAPRIY